MRGCTRFVLDSLMLLCDKKAFLKLERCDSMDLYFILHCKVKMTPYSDLQSFYFAFSIIEAFHQVPSCASTERHWFHCRQPCCYVHLRSQQDKSAEQIFAGFVIKYSPWPHYTGFDKKYRTQRIKAEEMHYSLRRKNQGHGSNVAGYQIGNKGQS